MAAIFQIRRGGSSYTSSLVSGELYLNTNEGALQVGTSGNPIKLLSLNTASFGDIILTGSAYISGNVVLGGTITIGDSTSDSVIFNADLSSSIIPDGTNVYDLGATNKVYRNLYATSISGAIAATNGVVSGSSQIVSILVHLNDFSGSQLTQNTALETISGSLISTASANTISITNLNSFSSSQLTQNGALATISGSLISTASNHEQRLGQIESKSGSYDTRFNSLATISGSLISTASVNTISITNLNSFSSSQLTENSNLATITGSLISTASANVLSIAELNSYTSSLKTAITASGADITINGNLTVKGTTTQIDSTTLNIGDNIIQLNGSSVANAGLQVKDTTGASGSLLWDSTLDYWKGGTLGNESKLLLAGGDSVISASSQLTELNSFTGSQLTQNTNLATISGSLILTASANTISITNLNSFSSSQLSQNTTLATISGSLISTASANTISITNINTITASLNTSVTNINSFTSSQLTQNTTLGSYTASVNQTTSSLNSYTASANAWSGTIDTRFTTLGTYTASVNQTTSSLNLYTASANTWSGTIDTRFTTLGTYTASVNQTTSSLNSYTASISTSFGQFSSSYAADSASFDYRIDTLDPGNLSGNLISIQQTTSSLNTFSASANIRLNNIEAATSSYETNGRGIVSGSSQITSVGTLTSLNVSPGAITGSSTGNIIPFYFANQAAFPSAATYHGAIAHSHSDGKMYFAHGGVWNELANANGNISGSSQVDGTAITNKSITIAGTSVSLGGSITAEVILGGTNVVSGSSQILGGSGVFSGSSQVNADSITNFDSNVKDKLTAEGVVSGSSQINLGSATGNITLATQTTGDYVASLVQGTGVTITNNSGENSTPTITIGQAVGISSNVQFNSIGLGTAASGVVGEVRATGDITAFYSSDIRLKENIVPIENALSKVESISGNTYDWKEGYEEFHSHKGNDVGVIAQEIEAILPQIVTNRDNGYKAVQYEKIVPLLIEAIKELSAKIKRLENK